ncbi:MAG: ferritin-like domain-containing protein [Candidatus Eremiobacteraeota bacterium]|nr:ferritin-like domain-containing protein [Candidatus Eremiobacteraeota bacterium]MCW5869869.1 ferritin-like domain-containing protein [Candidatus Eremiobacteraeota bacterium]
MSKIKTIDQLFVHEIADLMSAEEQLIEALPKMAEAATAKELKKAIEMHLKETEKQLQRLEKIAEEIELKASDKKVCKAMKGLVAEGQEAIKEIPAGPVRDVAIIGAAQRVEHYEIAGYGTARALAEGLKLKKAMELLDETLQEEGETDKKLTKIAESVVNPEALATA